MPLTKEQLQESKFYLDAEPDVIHEGYTKGDTWNGFSCPYFETDVAKDVAEQYVRIHEDDGSGRTAEYDPEREVFRFYEPVYDEWDEVKPVEVDGLKLYPIGAYSWSWSEVRDE
jgi:hypothetical protein